MLFRSDDSGSKQWDNPFTQDFIDRPPVRNEQNLPYWRNNYFVLAGLYISNESMSELNPLINSAKTKLFGTKYVDLHSVDLRNKYKRKKKYLDQFNISAKQLSTFINDFWYPLFSTDKMKLIAIVLDKRYYNNSQRNKSPLEIAAEGLFDHTELHPYSDCNIIFDQMDDKIGSKTRNQGKILQISKTKINLEDGKYAQKYHHTSVHFENSLLSNFLQLADMVAYNVARQFIEYGDEWDKHSKPGEHRKLPTYPYFELISKHFYHTKDNRVSGQGIIKLPDPFNSGTKGWNID